jgi:phosphoglycolate phosphatase
MSFLQMLLPLSVTAKGVLWTIFFGLAKTAQYTALAILGTSGYQRLKRIFVRR